MKIGEERGILFRGKRSYWEKLEGKKEGGEGRGLGEKKKDLPPHKERGVLFPRRGGRRGLFLLLGFKKAIFLLEEILFLSERGKKREKREHRVDLPLKGKKKKAEKGFAWGKRSSFSLCKTEKEGGFGRRKGETPLERRLCRSCSFLLRRKLSLSPRGEKGWRSTLLSGEEEKALRGVWVSPLGESLLVEKDWFRKGGLGIPRFSKYEEGRYLSPREGMWPQFRGENVQKKEEKYHLLRQR